MDLPIRKFWFLFQMVERLRAEDARVLLEIGIATQSGEGVKEAYEALENDVGQICVWEAEVPKVIEIDSEELDPEFDREGLNALKRKLRAENMRKR